MYVDVDLHSSLGRSLRLEALRLHLEARQRGYTKLALEIEQTIKAVEREGQPHWWQFWK